MSTVKAESKIVGPRGIGELKTQRVDILASLMMAVLMVLGLIVSLLFVVWLTQTFTFGPGDIKIEAEIPPGRGDHAAGFERDIEPPGAEEVQDLTEPTLEQTLEAVTEAATSVAASLDSVVSDSAASSHGTGQGDERPPGPLGEGDDVVPRYERWQLKFQAKGIKGYAQQLDYYKIELACIGGGVRTVDYATNVSSTPQKRSGTSEAENKQARLYFMWRQDGPLKEFDKQLLGQAGVTSQGRQILKFIPKPLEDQLAQVEARFFRAAGKTTIKDVAKTVFESRAAAAGGYEFVVVEQLYRDRGK